MTNHNFFSFCRFLKRPKDVSEQKTLKSCHDGSKKRQRSKQEKIRHEKINKRGRRKGRKKEAKQCRKKGKTVFSC